MALGDYIRTAREDQGMSLRDVENRLKEIEGSTKVSSGHLSLIEQGKVATPEPKTLHSLASAIPGLDYIRLMVEAGYLSKDVLGEREEALAFSGAEKLTEEEKAQVQGIIDLLTQKRRRTGNK
jgi:hypothetical protein